LPHPPVHELGWAGGVQTRLIITQLTAVVDIVHPTFPPGMMKLASESAACLEGRKAPLGMFGVTVLTM
jgi:hypothetical protein